MLVKALSRKLLGYFGTLLFIATVAGCGGGGGGDSTGNTTESPIVGNETLIEARTSGGIMVATVNDTVSLDGSKSYISSNTPKFTSSNAGLSYSWSFSFIPEGSSATLQNASSATPSFVGDVIGDYIVQLIVSANGYTSKRTLQSIVVAAVGDKKPTGTWGHEGLGTNCVQCHDGNYIFKDASGATKTAMGKSGDHASTSMLCQACHITKSFATIINTDHEEVFGSCSGCHNGVTAVGMSEFHQQTVLECDQCHNTVSFLTLEADGSYDHSNVTRSCSGCHNGKVARGKHDVHVDTTTDCGFCHTTVDFKNAYPDHTGPDVVGKDCASCHNGTDANNSTGFHSDMSVDCAVCHNINSFNSGGLFDHSLIDISVNPQVPACSECHDDSTANIGATQKPNDVTHSNLTSDCFVCHTTDDFTAFFMDHTIPPVTDFARCDACHGATTVVSPAVIASGLSLDHIATNGTDCGDCHTPGTFSTGIFDHAAIDMTVTRCDSCHDGSTDTQGLPSGHIPLAGVSPADCDVCHNDSVNAYSYSSFATPVNMDHTDAGVDSSVCGVCHDGDKSSGKSNGHIPTNVGPGPNKGLDCSDCHTTAMNYTSFALATFDHSPIDDTDCASCHDQGYATPKSATHIPSVAECSICHTNTSVGGFAAAINFRASSHDNLTRGCEGCHIAKFFPDNVNSYKANTHLPTTQDCYFCHSASATAFKPSTFSHQGITSNCVSCHDGSANNVAVLAVGEPNDSVHTGINADCSICHNSTSWAPQDVDHSRPDILSVRCDSCHNGSFEPDIPGKNTGHPSTSSDCKVCHSTDNGFLDGGVDHTSAEVTSVRCDSCHTDSDPGVTSLSNHPTGNHIPVTDDCDACHTAGGDFKPSTFSHAGITDNCESCHSGSYIDAIGKQAMTNPAHIPTDQDCSVCHTLSSDPISFKGASKFDHQGVTNNCVSCHNGVATTGKNSTHFPTDRDCVDCHKTTQTFADGTFDHQGVSANCSSCHDAGYAITGKHTGHPLTSKDCSVCHSGFVSFADGVFNHSDIANGTTCESCHDGNTATGKIDAPTPHLDTSLDCGECHLNAGGSFQGGGWVHDSTTAGYCTNCHDGQYANVDSKSSSHINTSDQCDVCHTTSTWGFDHPLSIPGLGGSGPYNPLDHRQSLSCSDCHGNTITATIPNNEWSNTTYKPYCAGCHDRDYDTGERRHRSLAEDKDCYGSCHEHRISSSNWD